MPARIAAQLYTVREYTKTSAEFDSVLGLCHEIGYEGVQLSAVSCMDGYEPEVDASRAKEMLEDHGLVCCATHAPLDRLKASTDSEIAKLQTLGCDYVAIGGIWPQDRSEFQRFPQSVALTIAKLKSAGIRFGYHNHSHEFFDDHERQYGVVASGTAYEHLIESSEDLMLELDTYWAVHAGVDPAALLRRCKGRVPVIHVKDRQVVPGQEPTYAPVGEGNLDWKAILDACEFAGVEWLVVEQDTCLRDPFDCLRASFDNLDAWRNG
jgi:sugar phosphate isomerase/epimerase